MPSTLIAVLNAIGKPAAWVLSGSGVLLLASSLGEHIDVVLSVLGVSALVIGFMLRGWMARREAFELATSKTLTEHTEALAKWKARDGFLERVADAFDQHVQDEREFQRFTIERLAALTPHLGPPPADMPQRRKLVDTQEIQRRENARTGE